MYIVVTGLTFIIRSTPLAYALLYIVPKLPGNSILSFTIINLCLFLSISFNVNSLYLTTIMIGIAFSFSFNDSNVLSEILYTSFALFLHSFNNYSASSLNVSSL